MSADLSPKAFQQANCNAYVRLKNSYGEVLLDVTRAIFSYVLGAPAKMTLLFPMGRNLAPGKDAKTYADITPYLQYLSHGTEVYLYVTLNGQASPSKRWTSIATDCCVFRGEIDGVSYGVDPNLALCTTLSVIHWTGALTSTSKYAAGIHPGSASDLFAASIADPTQQDTNINVFQLGPDWEKEVWKNALLPLCEKLTKISYSLKLSTGSKVVLTGNKKAVDILTEAALNLPAEYAPLEVAAFVNEGDVKASLQNLFMQDVLSMSTGASMWDTIVNVLAPLGLQLVTTQKSLFPIPLCPGRRIAGDPSCKTIYSNEYYSIPPVPAFTNERPVSCVRLFLQDTDPVQRAGTAPETHSLFGMYPTDADAQTLTTGDALTVHAPTWISAACRSANLPQTDVLAKIPSAYRRGTPPELLDVSLRGLGVAMARSVYFARKYQGKTLSVEGRLRFDIAPGSYVRIEPAGLAIDGVTSGDSFFGGYVSQVSFELDAVAGRAVTAIQIESVRTTFDENLHPDDAAEHVFVKDAKAWTGTEIVPGMEG